jgi:GNAT superfamily N-acetyltransferase
MNAYRVVIFKTPGYKAAILGNEDVAVLQDLLLKASDYNLLVTGKPPSPNAARELLADFPPGKTLDDKLALGIFEDGEVLVGVMDIVRDYPESGVWWIGLLLLDPAKRGHGLGEALYHSFERWAAQTGAVEIGLGVVEKNVLAVRFWKRLGFVTLEKKTHSFGRIDQVVLRMRRKISQSG